MKKSSSISIASTSSKKFPFSSTNSFHWIFLVLDKDHIQPKSVEKYCIKFGSSYIDQIQRGCFKTLNMPPVFSIDNNGSDEETHLFPTANFMAWLNLNGKIIREYLPFTEYIFQPFWCLIFLFYPHVPLLVSD